MTGELRTYRPVDLPMLRDELQDFAATPIAREWDEMGLAQPIAVAAGVAAGNLYFIAEPMVEVCLAARTTLPDFAVEPQDVPAPTGMMYFAKPMAEARMYKWVGGIDAPGCIVGAAWRWFEDDLLVTWLLDKHHMFDGRSDLLPEATIRQIPRLFPLEAVSWTAQIPDGIVEEEVPEVWGRRFLKTAWLLMQQPITALEDAPMDRAVRRRAKRRNLEPPRVRVIKLRRPATTSDGDGGPGRGFQHQWVVRGHWRQHWHPKRGVHRPLWISPYVKGPQDAPLLGAEKVYAWTR